MDTIVRPTKHGSFIIPDKEKKNDTEDKFPMNSIQQPAKITVIQRRFLTKCWFSLVWKLFISPLNVLKEITRVTLTRRHQDL